jgi:seryl-tRNA synthetase
MLEIKELNLPKDPGRAPQINWGEDFENFDDIRKIIYLKKLCSALNHATDLIQKERNQLLVDIKVCNEAVENADKAVSIQKAIVLKAITDHNIEKQEFAKQLQTLEKEIKEKNKIIEDLEFLRDK